MIASKRGRQAFWLQILLWRKITSTPFGVCLLRFPLLLCCSRLLIKLGLVCRLDLSPHLAEDLRHLADARVRVLLPHRRPVLVHEEEIGAHWSFWRIWILLFPLFLLLS